jgi:hypothetical protein
MAAFQTMSGELLRKKGSYLFGDPVENKVVRSGKVVRCGHARDAPEAASRGSKAQSSVFYQMYPDATVPVREIVWLCGGGVVLSLDACDVVFVACECELLPHTCSAGDAARVVCTQVSKHFSSRRNSFQSLLHLNGFSFDRDNNEQVAFSTDEGPNGYLCWPRELLAAIRRPNESLTDSKLTYIAYFWEMCWDVCIDDDLNASRSAGKHGGVEAAELADED